MRSVGEGDGAGLAQQPEFRHLLAGEALGDRRRRQDAHAGVAGAPLQEVDHRGVVDRRRGVGPRDQRRDAAGRRRRRRAGDGLAVLGPGLADEHAHVDQPRRDHVAAAVDHASALRRRLGGDRGAEAGDPPVDHQHAAGRLRAAGGIDETGVDEGERRHRRGCSAAACGEATRWRRPRLCR